MNYTQECPIGVVLYFEQPDDTEDVNCDLEYYNTKVEALTAARNAVERAQSHPMNKGNYYCEVFDLLNRFKDIRIEPKTRQK